ncbi:gluconate 2-dehydrogenase subunit 3 family protein [Crocinitomix catalasitica]|uniref:gluconate 2-dehydrogenase subunit 3 family protein n=1 Tax=Crocinitomix catalasitica TaxID=184607 RepID=UPI000684BBB2|nr:gluconate 2-dehydrogenase subunit 3 family protein [Crocinitomix catalasitica]
MIDDKEIAPDLLDSISTWQVNRRKLLKAGLLAGAMTQINLFTSCSTELKSNNDVLNAQQSLVLETTLNVLFPDDGNGPSADDINAFGYFIWAIQDDLNRKQEANTFIIDGLDWVNKKAIQLKQTNFYSIPANHRTAFIDEMVKTKYGKKWVSAMVTLLFEALLLDPLYGGNKEEKGWKWLNHTPGFPRPTEELRYEVLMKKQLKIKQ